MARYRVRNWDKYQHYKDRNPPWIKLHVEILQSEDWVMLDDASKLLAVVCMVVAAKDNGEFNGNPDYLKRVAYLDKKPNLNPLIECGFIEEALADDSASKRTHTNVRPEKESETEKEHRSSPGAKEAKRRVAVGNRVLEAAGIDPTKWVGDFSVVSGWLNAGYDVDLDILPAVKATMERKRDGPPGSLHYFNKPIQKAYEARQAIPEATRKAFSPGQEKRAAENIQRLLAMDIKPSDFKAATGHDVAEAETSEVEAFLQARSLELPEFLRRTA